MFSGIIEETGILQKIEQDGGNVHFTFSCSFVKELDVDQSVAHNGVCLTVVSLSNETYAVTAIRETLEKSNLAHLRVGDKVNLERSMKPAGLLDGHIVQGHVDQTAVCTEIKEADGSWYFTFSYEPTDENITVEKGSVSVNGVSLTVVNSRDNSFQVAIIPFTHSLTNFHTIEIGTVVNLEFDIIGKYITKIAKNYLQSIAPAIKK